MSNVVKMENKWQLKNENISLLSVSKGTEKCHIKLQQFLKFKFKNTKIKIMVSSSKSGYQLKKNELNILINID